MRIVAFFALILFTFAVGAQENISFQKPSKEILELVDVERAPSVYMDEKKQNMLLLYRNAFKTIEVLSKKEMRLGGLRIDPATNMGSRTSYFNNIKLKRVKKGTIVQVKGLPSNPKLSSFSWSPDQMKMAFTHTTATGAELWVMDIKSATAGKLTDANLNGNMGRIAVWSADSKSLLVKMVSSERKPLIDTKSAVPTGPTVSVNSGKKARNRTYQDLLKNKSDEHNFEQLALSEIYRVELNGNKTKWMKSNMYRSLSFSPDGNYVMVKTVAKPFSYLVPYYRFPAETTVYTKEGKKVETVLIEKLVENLPKGFMAVRTGRRGITWRGDKPATLIYVEALDGGNPANKAEYRDEVFELNAPFKGKGKSLIKVTNRFSGITWATDKIAVAGDYWWNTRNTKSYVFNPSNPKQKPVVLFDYNYQNRYKDPGSFVTEKNRFGRSVISVKKGNAYLLGAGYTPKGQFPFLDRINLKTRKTRRLYKSVYKNKLERLVDFDAKRSTLLVRIESKSEYPNYFFRKLGKKKLKQLTAFKNPFKSIQNVHKEVIKYKRYDGLELSGTLYLPVGYDMKKKERVPLIIWAYPREYKNKATASQSTGNPNRFTYPYYGSPVYWIAKGYAVLDGAAFPIVGEGKEEPNDTFRKQLVGNAKAAIDAVYNMGYIDKNRVACGGHSYGAFMVANLLSHSNLFAAGIARSGAYNRTLTPFGFQSEERSYWEAPEVYYKMSPFMHADKMKTPMLLIHGEADNNSGTYPMQSKRYFNALKGLGATVRLVMLPKESHGYKAKENILHLLWEQDQWLEKYVKNRKVKK